MRISVSMVREDLIDLISLLPYYLISLFPYFLLRKGTQSALGDCRDKACLVSTITTPLSNDCGRHYRLTVTLRKPNLTLP
jgi:hypothetical protein